MKKLRTLLTGLILGGGFGSGFGSFISTLSDFQNPILFLEIGLLGGGLLGIGLSTAVLLTNLEIANK